MDPADAVRYSLPAMPLAALLAAFGLGALRDWTHVRVLPLAAAAAVAALSVWYVFPILHARAAGPSPVVQAAEWVRANVPTDAVLLYQTGTKPHVEWLLPEYAKKPLDEGLREYYAKQSVKLVAISDGATREPEAKVFSWPASEAYVKMTRNFGRRISVDPIRPEERFLPGPGVYALESTAEDGDWRWLQPSATLLLPPLGKSSLTLKLDLVPETPYATDDVQVFADGVLAATGTVTREPSIVTVPLSPGARSIEIRSAHSFRPAETLGNQDPRVLAVQLVDLEQR
jgi:hypothetical protein